MSERTFQFEWDAAKADLNVRKHSVDFRLAASIFLDPRILTVADLEHSESEERWFSVGVSAIGVLLSVAYLWSDVDPGMIKIRIISARKATPAERSQYEEAL